MTTPWEWVFSKAPIKGQWIRALRRLAASIGRCTILAGLLAVGLGSTSAASGAPVLRYSTLKTGPVTARSGPGESFRALWRYTAEGLPLQIVEAIGDWRRVCDPGGGLGWVRAGVLADQRSVMRAKGGDLALRARPADGAPAVAMLSARGTAEMIEAKGGWRRIAVDHASGWVRAGEVWGGSDAPQCEGR